VFSSGLLRIHMATLARLVLVRSQRAERLRQHLEPLASSKAWPLAPWLRRADLTLDQVYVEPDVVPWRNDREPETVDMELHAAMVPGSDERNRVRWAAVWQNKRRAIVLGRPGEGETTLLQRTCQRVADLSLEQWHAQKTSLDQIPIPIWLRAADIIRAGSVTAALGLVPGSPPVANVALSAEDLRAALGSRDTWLFVDALDEPPDGSDPADNAAALATLAGIDARLLLSVRSYAWPGVQGHLPFTVASGPGSRNAGASGRQRRRRLTTNKVPPAPVVDTLTVYELAPLTREQRVEVVTNWFSPVVARRDADRSPRARRARDRDARDERCDQVIAHLDEVPMQELTSNALTLTLLCAAMRSDPARRISGGIRRVQLYAWLVADLVTRADKLALDPNSSAAENRVLALARAAWALWQVNPGGPFEYQDWADQLRVACDERTLPAGVYQQVLAEVERTGLLVSDGRLRRFFPQTAYEYLAGAGLVQDVALAPDAPVRAAHVLVDHAGETTWRELSDLALGHLGVIRGRADLVSRVVDAALEAAKGGPGAAEALLGEALVEAGERDASLPPAALTTALSPAIVTPAVRQRVIDALLLTMRADTAVAAPVRARAGAALGWLGDRRFDPHAFHLPVATPEDPLRGFIVVPAGSFRMGSDRSLDPDADDTEMPTHDVRIEHPFFMARWPVITAAFAAYVQASGEQPQEPECLTGDPTAPVVWVGAEEAGRYCVWLTAQLADLSGPLAALGRMLADHLGAARVEARLPTEQEWEYVAKGGAEGRIYPWGAGFDSNKANVRDTGIGGPSAVGCFPGGAGRWGVEEQSGNVWEWTASGWRRDYQPGSGEDPSRRGVRGGAFIDGPRYVRSACRGGGRPPGRFDDVGFRVVVFPFGT